MSKHSASLVSKGRIQSTVRAFLDNETSSGLLLMGIALLAILTANSPLAEAYFGALHITIGPLSLQHWINDLLMAAFFLLVGLEIKRELLDGQLSTWSRRILPGAAAAGGMAIPALIYIAFNYRDPVAVHGWAVPSATDIAFALGVLSLLGPRVPASLKIFLAALAIIDDLGAVVIIALFYTSGMNVMALGGAALVIGALIALNRTGVQRLLPYLALGAVLWILVFASGVHATLAGVILALTIPIRRTPGTPEATPDTSPLHRLEHALHKPVAFIIVPIFGFANAGVSFAHITLSTLAEPVTLGVAMGLVLGKCIGVFGTVFILVKMNLADLPAKASWGQTLGVSLVCGIGFTMSLFIGLLAFSDPDMQDRVKVGILIGSLIAGLLGYTILRITNRRAPVVGVQGA
ncbi:sodium:proton antiporter [Rhizobium sp. Leaf384]|uniref:Na+/H+ antiporter NhaA n=1 Tax=unclassified Rhizobium TaxID=2613769 RepID=UPI000715C9DB|nr:MULTISPECIES: Na+/H+ antiporter NhaA [unclassified Rhizobium]KQS81660.1 sodium:proton antiporter [Rhizobium sp. Leaf384]KQS87429.1 sodium:proton antiporter [Rhizobium sp. Leaf383]